MSSSQMPDHAVAVGVDGSAESIAALDWASAHAEARGLPLHIVHAADGLTWAPADDQDDPEDSVLARSSARQFTDNFVHEHDVLDQMLAPWATRFPRIEVRRRAIRSDPIDALLGESRHAALLVVGSHGRQEVRGLVLGSVSQEAMRRAECPVTVVPPGVGTEHTHRSAAVHADS